MPAKEYKQFLMFSLCPGMSRRPSESAGVSAAVLPCDADLSQINMENEKSPDG